MFDKLATVSRSQPFFDFPQEPFVVVHQPLYRFLHQSFGIAALLGSHPGQLGLQIGTQVYFHVSSLRRRRGTVKVRGGRRRKRRYTPRTAALTGREPTGITVSSAAKRLRFLVIVPMRSTATSPDLRFSTRAY